MEAIFFGSLPDDGCSCIAGSASFVAAGAAAAAGVAAVCWSVVEDLERSPAVSAVLLGVLVAELMVSRNGGVVSGSRLMGAESIDLRVGFNLMSVTVIGESASSPALRCCCCLNVVVVVV